MQNFQDYTREDHQSLAVYKQNLPIELRHPSAFLLNIFLRAGASLPDNLGSMAGNLLRSFKKPHARIREEIVLFRATNWNEIERHILNGKYTEHGFISTSSEQTVTHGFFEAPRLGYIPAALEIICPENTPVLFFTEDGSFADDLEYEGLLCAGSTFSIETEDVTNECEINELVGRDNYGHKIVKWVKLKYLTCNNIE